MVVIVVELRSRLAAGADIFLWMPACQLRPHTAILICTCAANALQTVATQRVSSEVFQICRVAFKAPAAPTHRGKLVA